MEFVLGFLGAVLGVAVVAIGGIFSIKRKVSKVISPSEFNQMKEMVKNVKTIQEQEYTRVKDVSGMTTLLEPRILRDFEDFNKEVIYSKTEKNLSAIFDAIEAKNINKVADSEYDLIRNSVQEKIDYLRENGITERYMDVKFHKHAIKNYEKRDGMAIITISSSVEYYYKNSKEAVKYAGKKKQTRYTTKYSYVYDESKIGKDTPVYTVNCPNCGAPIVAIGKNIVCNFCASHIQPVNLKIWKISSYEEDYKEGK